MSTIGDETSIADGHAEGSIPVNEDNLSWTARDSGDVMMILVDTDRTFSSASLEPGFDAVRITFKEGVCRIPIGGVNALIHTIAHHGLHIGTTLVCAVHDRTAIHIRALRAPAPLTC